MMDRSSTNRPQPAQFLGRWLEADEVCRDDLNLTEVQERLDDAVKLIDQALRLIPFDTRGRQRIDDACTALEREGWG